MILLRHETYANPNTPIPSALRDLVKPGPEGVEIDNLPMQIVDTQYPKTFFYEEDLHPEKTMNVQFSKSPFTQPFTVFAWLKGLEIKDIEKGHTFADICMMREHVEGERNWERTFKYFQVPFVDKQEQYTVEGVQNLGGKAVMCHRLNFRTAVFYCHVVHGTTAFIVPMVAGDGTKTRTLSCGQDTAYQTDVVV
ncbi:hypothetical protein D0Y65_019523 [Glycine soja]|uniref:BURP domain-containing protein n=2 Tax=Glycine subgen. Soja TaxID=1462606 RepID=A0A0R0IGJ2_SOYBN|nr:hypothetical protein D0Y65_019523 [Glycine soja]